MTATTLDTSASSRQLHRRSWKEHGGQQWASLVAPTTQQCQRHGWVPDPRNPVGQLAMRATWSGDQNPLWYDSRFRNSLCGPSTQDTTSPTSRNERRSCHSICASSGSHAVHTPISRAITVQSSRMVGSRGKAACHAPPKVTVTGDRSCTQHIR